MIVTAERLTKRFAVRRPWVEAVRRPFGGTTVAAVEDVSFGVAEGEVFGLLGRNGAGKTTIFRMLATLVLPDAGAATIGGFDVSREGHAVRALLAPVAPNERSLNWRLGAVENLRLFAALQGLHGAEARADVARVLAVTGLTDTGDKLVGAFSSGMRQRLLIARALLGRPRVLLLDEPTRSLDPLAARDFRRFLRETVVRAEGCTVLLATHDADEVWELCDRVGVLERGRLLTAGATDDLRHRTGGDRYVAWLDAARAAEAVDRLGGLARTTELAGPAAEPGWVALALDLPGGADAAAAALARLMADGTRVARFERAAPTLADLIERVLRTARDGGTDA